MASHFIAGAPTQRTAWATLDRSYNVVRHHRAIAPYLRRRPDPDLDKWLWMNHQAACDLYLLLVEQYISLEDKFTYADLQKLCENKSLMDQWGEQHWRYLMMRRPENVNTPPEFFTTIDETTSVYTKSVDADLSNQPTLREETQDRQVS